MKGWVPRRAMPVAFALALLLGPVGVPLVLSGVTGTGVDDAYAVNEDRRLRVDAPGVLANDGPPGPHILCVDLQPGRLNTTGLRGQLNINFGRQLHVSSGS